MTDITERRVDQLADQLAGLQRLVVARVLNESTTLRDDDYGKAWNAALRHVAARFGVRLNELVKP